MDSIGSKLPGLIYRTLAEAKDDEHGYHDDGHGGHEFGVHITYEDLYDTVIFLAVIYVAGQIAARLLKMPCLVGEIVAGIILGPPLIDFVPNAEAWVLLGELGLILLVLEAGIDIDVATLKLIGTRGCLIALIGSILPIGFGVILAIIMIGTNDVKAVIAAGAVFGPTSLGIALNILRGGGVLNTPVGQLIISAAVIDDMIALIVLSQLEALTGEIDVVGVLIPVISALLFLIVGGYLALFVIPGVVEKLILNRTEPVHRGKIELAIMFGFLIAMMPATHYAKASYLMGAFISGLAFCTSHDLHENFVTQFKRLLQWLMRIFFAASIGFQVPIKDFASGTVIWQGLVFCIALVGKLIVGFMVPNFTPSRMFTGLHLRDCLITGFSMAAEGEFAFVIAVFSVENELIDKDLYASVVLAVLLSTIIPPFLLRFTISHYNKKAEQDIKNIAEQEMERNHDLEVDTASIESQKEDALVAQIRNQRAVFLCIQTQSEARWGLLLQLMASLGRLGLDVIDHRSWHPRGINSTLVNEVYCKDKLNISQKGTAQELLEERIDQIRAEIDKTINQPDTSKIKVQRWFPGVVEEIIESVHERTKQGKKNLNLEERLLREAAERLDQHHAIQTLATKEKSVDEILAGMQSDKLIIPSGGAGDDANNGATATNGGAEGATAKPTRRRRQKMRSTPVVGGGLFGENESTTSTETPDLQQISATTKDGGSKKWNPNLDFGQRGHKAEIIVEGESYTVRINDETLKALRKGFSGDMLNTRGIRFSGISIQPDRSNVVNQLTGYVRSQGPLSKITEEIADSESETSSIYPDNNNNKSGNKHHQNGTGGNEQQQQDQQPPV